MYVMIYVKIVIGDCRLLWKSFMWFLLILKKNYEFRELRIYCFRFIFVLYYFLCYIMEDNSCNIFEIIIVNGYKM